MMNVNLHIERIILDGLPVPRRQHEALRTAIAEELARLVRDGGIGPDLASGGDFASVPAGTVRFSENGAVEGYGRQIAQAVYGGIGIPVR